MSVRWKHKLNSKEGNAKSLCLVLAGAGFLKDKKGDFSVSKISLFILGLFVLIAGIYLVSAVQEITTVTLNTTDSYGFGMNYTWENLTANVNPFNSSQKYLYDWRKDGNSIAVLNMPFESNATCGIGGDLACDYSDGGNNATVNNGVIYNSSGGYDGNGAYEFDGVDDYLSVQNVENFNFSGGEGFTVMAWIKPNDLPSEEGDIITHYYSTGDNRVWVLQIKDGIARFIGHSNGTSSPASYATGETLVNDSDTWYHLAGRWNGTNLQVYVNGVSDDPSPPSLTEIYSMTDRNIRIGLSTTGSGYFNGTIDDILIFNRSLSDSQILAIYDNETDLIVSQETSFGENWSVMATPVYDGEVGSGVLSNNLTILNATTGCPSTPQNWEVSMGDYIWVNELCNLTGFNITFSGVGNFTVNATIYVNEIKNLSSGMTVFMKPNATMWVGAN